MGLQSTVADARPTCLDGLTGPLPAGPAGGDCAGSDPFSVFFLADWGLGSVPDPVPQMLNLFSKLHQLLHRCFCTAKQTANAVRVPQVKGLHHFAKRCNRQASRQPSRYVSASPFAAFLCKVPPETDVPVAGDAY